MLARISASFSFAALLTCLGCGGSGGAPGSTVPRADPSGLWSGTVTYESATSLPAFAIVQNDILHAYTFEDIYWINTRAPLQVSGNELVGSGIAFIANWARWTSTGTFWAPASFVGKVTEKQSMNFLVTQDSFKAAYSLTFDGSILNRSIDLSSVAGEYYSDHNNNSSRGYRFITLESNGKFVIKDTFNGVGNFGTITSLYPNVNLFHVNYINEKNYMYSGNGYFSDSLSGGLNNQLTLVLTSVGFEPFIMRMKKK